MKLITTLINRIPLSETAKNELWESAIFVFDTNALLDLYRSSEKYVNELVAVINDKSPNIWLPKQVVLEFEENRWNIIYDNADRYSPNGKIRKAISSLIDACKDSIDDNYINELERAIDNWLKAVKENDKRVIDPFNDTILEKLLEVFDGKVGQGFSNDEIKSLEDDGKKRFDNKIPPGYKDNNKDDNKYGDYIIWREIINYSKEKDVDIIFVTQDKKEDWWDSKRGRTIGPRYELREEFNNETNHIIHFYTTDRFLEENNKRSEKIADRDIIDEAVKLSNAGNDNEDTEYKDYLNTFISAFLQNYGSGLIDSSDYSTMNIDKALDTLQSIQNLRNQRRQVEIKLHNMNNYLKNFRDEYRPEDKERFEKNISNLEKDLEMIDKRLKYERYRYKALLIKEITNANNSND